MKRYLTILLLFWTAFVSAQRYSVREEVLSDGNLAGGLDALYDCSAKPSTPAPAGYKAFYISHYGRHGSRYAYTAQAYTVPLEYLRRGAQQGKLTERGKSLLKDLEAFWEAHQYQVGDLTSTGWAQHQYIAETMASSFPGAFGKGSQVDACSSASNRAILSMTSCTAALARKAPKTSVYAHQGVLDVQATRPNQGANPFKYAGPEEPFPYPETDEEFFQRTFPEYKAVLSRLFTDPSVCKGERLASRGFFFLYLLVAGMNSVPPGERIDVSGIFTPLEYAHMWESFNFFSLREYVKYRTPCSSVVDDMVAKADARIALRGTPDAAASCGADLRFGHDHVLMALFQIMDINGMGEYPASAEDLALWFQTFHSPMAGNIQLVFYAKPCGKGDILVKLLLNGEEARFWKLEGGPYYKWEDLRTYLGGRTALFVTR